MCASKGLNRDYRQMSVPLVAPANCWKCRFYPWVVKIPWRRKWQPTPVSLPGKSMDRRAWQATVGGVAKELNMTEQLNNSTYMYMYTNTIRNAETNLLTDTKLLSYRAIKYIWGHVSISKD